MVSSVPTHTQKKAEMVERTLGTIPQFPVPFDDDDGELGHWGIEASSTAELLGTAQQSIQTNTRAYTHIKRAIHS